MANRGSKKNIPITIKEVSIISRVILYIMIAIVIGLSIFSAVYAIGKVGMLGYDLDPEYLVTRISTDSMLMVGNNLDTSELVTNVLEYPNEYVLFTALVFGKYSFQYALLAIIFVAITLFLDFDNLKNPFTKKSTRIVDTIIGTTMVMFFVNVIINFQIRLNCPHFVDIINTYVFPLGYALITFGLLVFNYCLRCGKDMIEGGK